MSGDENDSHHPSANPFRPRCDIDSYQFSPKESSLCQASTDQKHHTDLNIEFQNLLESMKNMGCRDEDLFELES